MILEPIDRTHADCLAARDQINTQAHRIRLAIHAWEPQPCPPPPPTTRTGERK
jgi:hypothetical protein